MVALLALSGCAVLDGPHDVRMPRGETEWRQGCRDRGGEIVEKGRELLCLRTREEE
jgi:hypothetical protein